MESIFIHCNQCNTESCVVNHRDFQGKSIQCITEEELINFNEVIESSYITAIHICSCQYKNQLVINTRALQMKLRLINSKYAVFYSVQNLPEDPVMNVYNNAYASRYGRYEIISFGSVRKKSYDVDTCNLKEHYIFNTIKTHDGQYCTITKEEFFENIKEGTIIIGESLSEEKFFQYIENILLNKSFILYPIQVLNICLLKKQNQTKVAIK
jgi:hypothetical protein